MGVSSSESHDLTAFYEMLSASFGVLSQNTGFYPSLDRIIETTLRPLNLGPGGGSYNEPISRLQRLAHHLAHPSTHLCAPPCTSAHLCAPLCTLLHTSVHLCTPPCISAHLHAPLHNFCTSLSRASHPYRTFHFDLRPLRLPGATQP